MPLDYATPEPPPQTRWRRWVAAGASLAALHFAAWLAAALVVAIDDAPFPSLLEWPLLRYGPIRHAWEWAQRRGLGLAATLSFSSLNSLTVGCGLALCAWSAARASRRSRRPEV